MKKCYNDTVNWCLHNERWLSVPKYDGIYEVSSFGRIRSLQRISIQGHLIGGIIMCQQESRGYLVVTLTNKDGKRKRFNVHRLVAIAFLNNPNNLPEVNHLDEDKFNNSVQNLDIVGTNIHIIAV